MAVNSQSTKSESSGVLTDEPYWEEHWRTRTRRKVLSALHGLWGRRGNFLSLLETRLGSLYGKEVLEIGGGYSIRLLALAKFRGCDCTALDFSPAGLDATRQLFAFNGCKVNTIQADMFECTFTRAYDLVCHWGVLEHFKDPQAVLKVSASALSPGGSLVFSMPNLEARGAALWRQYAPINYSHHIFHSDSDLRTACESLGLELMPPVHWGVPLIRIAPWERGGAALHLLTAVQLATYALAAVLPLFGHGSRGYSTERLFFARKPEAAAR
jgi:2-polyprenyl-3-methyl-5-hydroxy-6-metoxy-1,4-benzoquinol methylase